MKIFSIQKSIDKIIKYLEDFYIDTAIKNSPTNSTYASIHVEGYKTLRIRLSDHIQAYNSCDLYIQPLKNFPLLYIVHTGIGTCVSIYTFSGIKNIIKQSLIKKKIQETTSKKKIKKSEEKNIVTEALSSGESIQIIEDNKEDGKSTECNNSGVPDNYECLKSRKKNFPQFFNWYCKNIQDMSTLTDLQKLQFKAVFTTGEYTISEVQKILNKCQELFDFPNCFLTATEALKKLKSVGINTITDDIIEKQFKYIFCNCADIHENIILPSDLKDKKPHIMAEWYCKNAISINYAWLNVRDRTYLGSIILYYSNDFDTFHKEMINKFKACIYPDRAIERLYMDMRKLKRTEIGKITKEAKTNFFTGLIDIDPVWDDVSYRKEHVTECIEMLKPMFPWLSHLNVDLYKNFINLLWFNKLKDKRCIRIVEYLMISYKKRSVNDSLDNIINRAVHDIRNYPLLRWDFEKNKSYVDNENIIVHDLPVIPFEKKKDFIYHKKEEPSFVYDDWLDDGNQRIINKKELLVCLKKDIISFDILTTKRQNAIIELFSYDAKYGEIVKTVNSNIQLTKLLMHACYKFKKEHQKIETNIAV